MLRLSRHDARDAAAFICRMSDSAAELRDDAAYLLFSRAEAFIYAPSCRAIITFYLRKHLFH